MNEEEIKVIQTKCFRKWQAENPKGYIPAMKWDSQKQAADYFCRKAGFADADVADTYFAELSGEKEAEMMEATEKFEYLAPSREVAKAYGKSEMQGVQGEGIGLIALVFGVMIAAWLLLIGRR